MDITIIDKECLDSLPRFMRSSIRDAYMKLNFTDDLTDLFPEEYVGYSQRVNRIDIVSIPTSALTNNLLDANHLLIDISNTPSTRSHHLVSLESSSFTLIYDQTPQEARIKMPRIIHHFPTGKTKIVDSNNMILLTL